MCRLNCRAAGWSLCVSVGLSLFAGAGCDESLPPRDDPQNVLAVSLSGEPGTVALQEDLSMFSQIPGGFTVGLTNLHDEVLQAREDISIDITFSVQGSAHIGGTAHGDRNQLLNFMMMQGDLLTIEPESTATFFIQWDHGDGRLWESSGLTFHRIEGNPIDITWFKSGLLEVVASGTARFFENIAPVELPGARMEIDYAIFVADPQPVMVEDLIAVYDPASSGVHLSWFTPFEVQHFGFHLEKGMTANSFPYFYEDWIRGQGTVFDTTYYSYTDSLNISGGQWFYRLQRWYDFGFTLLQLDPTDSVLVLIP